jgi:hypothetical protein
MTRLIYSYRWRNALGLGIFLVVSKQLLSCIGVKSSFVFFSRQRTALRYSICGSRRGSSRRGTLKTSRSLALTCLGLTLSNGKHNSRRRGLSSVAFTVVVSLCFSRLYHRHCLYPTHWMSTSRGNVHARADSTDNEMFRRFKDRHFVNRLLIQFHVARFPIL